MCGRGGEEGCGWDADQVLGFGKGTGDFARALVTLGCYTASFSATSVTGYQSLMQWN